MGEPTPEIYVRHYEMSAWPVESTEELADYVEWLAGLLTHHDLTPDTKFEIDLLSRDREPPIPLDEFRERFDEFPFDKVFSASLESRQASTDLILKLDLRMSFLGDQTGKVTVTGTNRERVQGAKTEVRNEGDARFKARKDRRLEAKGKADADADFKRQEAAVGIGDAAGAIFRAEQQRERERSGQQGPHTRAKPVPASSPPDAPEPVVEKSGEWPLHRFFYNPWTITVVGGLLVGGVILIVTRIVAT
jgi:hypothetical protein